MLSVVVGFFYARDIVASAINDLWIHPFAIYAAAEFAETTTTKTHLHILIGVNKRQ